MLQAIGLTLAVIGVVGVLVLAWRQASKADALPENDGEIRKRINEREAEIAKLREIATRRMKESA